MSELIETLWKQFGIEAGEHFDAIDKLLSDSTGEVPERERIASLFRSFHSLKGASRAMDMFGQEKLAHRAETVLGRVRTGAIRLSNEIAEALLEALDALRALNEVAVRERRDAEPPAALLAKLEALGSNPEAAPPSLPVAEAPRPAKLHDNDKLMGRFVEHLREGMATLTRALDLDSLDEEGLRTVDNTAETLEIGCERLSLLPIADILRAFREHLKARDPDGILHDLQALALASARVGRLSGRDAGTAIIATLLADHNAQALAKGTGRALELMRDPATAGDELADVLDRIGSTLDIVRLPRSSALVRRIADVVRRMAPAQNERWPALLADARQAIDFIALHAAADPPEDVDADTHVKLERMLREFVETADAEEAARRPFSTEELRSLGLDEGLLRFLSPDSSAQLRAAVNDDAIHLYEVTAFLESDPTVASSFALWLGTKVQAITNWPEFVDGKTWLKVLIASAEGLDALRAAMRGMDASGELLRVRRCVPGEPTPTVSPAVVEPAPRAELVVAHSTPAPAEPLPAVLPTETRIAPPSSDTPPSVPRTAPGGGVLRVPGEVVDRFMARIDGMVLLSGDLNAVANDLRLEEAMGALAAKLGAGDPDLRMVQELMDRHRRAVQELDTQLSRSVDRLRESALDLRVVPVETLLNQYPRVVRELSRTLGKKIRLVVDGGDVRIDKSMVETLYDPLMHMVRNGVDHGIETPEEREAAGKPPQATLSLRAVQRGSRVIVEIADDGRGIATEAVRAKAVRQGLVSEEDSRRLTPAEIHEFIFASGFSTAETVTETSGRGVGMDVVRDAILRLGGTITTRTREGVGTSFVIDLPLSAAILRTLLVQVDDQVLAIPDRFIEEVCGFTTPEFHQVSGCRSVLRRNRVLPVVHLADALGFGAERPAPAPAAERLIVVLKLGDRRIGVEIDRLLRRGDLFVRESHPGLADVPGVGGVSLLNDGRIVVILDGQELFRLACAAQMRAPERPKAEEALTAEARPVLIGG
ncbi:MAG TPA: ATP-binding protein [Azospirillum sp.]|nr:ATP-binding protein [Azospirillum sp.]